MHLSQTRAQTSLGIVDIGLSNLGSIHRSVTELCDQVMIVTTPEQVGKVDRLILPGVGAFPAAMDRLESTGLAGEIVNFVRVLGRPTLGICLGMQLLATRGEEHQICFGLGLIEGDVRRFNESDDARVPHVGWNSVEVCRELPLFAGVGSGQDFYFVHSFRFETTNRDEVAATSKNGETFAAVIQRENLVGVQFHPEKSSHLGRRLLKNFCEWDPC